jgi:multidrug efflux pump subunit AcrA (membrane-fusion protein)
MRPAAEETISLTSEQLAKRLRRAEDTKHTKWLKEHGFENEEAFVAFKTAAQERDKAAEEARLAELSELEQAREKLKQADAAREAAEAARQAAERAAEDTRFELHFRDLCKARGISNPTYALFLLDQKLSSSDDPDEPIDEAKFLDDLAADESQKAALGLVTPREGAATTIVPRTGPAPQPDGTEPPKSVLDMTPEEAKAEAAKLGIIMP